VLRGATARRALRLAAWTSQAWLALIVFDVARIAGFGSVHDAIKRCRPRDPHRSTPAVDDIVWAIDEACVWYVKRAACLQRSVVTTWLLRRNGIEAALVIGYRPIPFESHAWVEVNGRIVNDRPQYQKFFRVLERL
jgi:Transglutaminase-like superfamily